MKTYMKAIVGGLAGLILRLVGWTSENIAMAEYRQRRRKGRP